MTYDQGVVTTSSVINITVLPNQLPIATITSPTANQRFTAPASITISADASDFDGNVSKVDFYQGITLIGTATNPPYQITWSNVPQGSYTLMAKVSDNSNGESYSAQVPITVGPKAMKVFYIHSDHLNTPRVVTDDKGKVIWRNAPLNEPFGNVPPEEDPDGDGQRFVFNLRAGGWQYFDQETGLLYNWRRSHDARAGGFTQSDPIGLAGGINTYAYVGGNPLSYVDPRGEFLVPAARFIFQNWGKVSAAASSAYAWYEAKKSTDEAAQAAAVYGRAAQAFDECIAKMARGVGCSCDVERKQLDEAYRRYIDSALDFGKSVDGVFPSKIPVGERGSIKRTW